MAATASPEIQVYATFPHPVALGTDLNVDPSNWHWVHCLTLPVETLKTLNFSQQPYKWIRYATGVVVGAEGHLSFSHNLPDVLEYDDDLPVDSTVLYYHTSDEEKRRMFPVDPSIGHTRITSSVSMSRVDDFRSVIVERDGNMCVLTRIRGRLCDAVHLLAHSKGDEYIATYTWHRSRDPERGDIVQEIDSIRNGLLLHNSPHRVLGQHVAFLMTPNFAMDTSDIDLTAPPAERRCTAHLFVPDERSYLGKETLPLGSPLHISEDPMLWPPEILFDAVYASAVLYHFGAQTMKDEVTRTWKDTFYPGAMIMADAELKSIKDERAVSVERTQKAHKAHYEAHSEPDTFDMLMTLPYIMVPRNELQAMLNEAEEKAEAMQQRHVHEKVDTWMKQITPDVHDDT